MGCFWSPDFFLSNLDGVKSVLVGYSGGDKENPTYTDLGDHSETVKIEFDPKILSYKELLAHFFKEHNPNYKNKAQYRSVVFYFDDEQKKLAEKAHEEFQSENKEKVETDIEPAKKFYPAEEYHQKYYEKNNVRGVC